MAFVFEKNVISKNMSVSTFDIQKKMKKKTSIFDVFFVCVDFQTAHLLEIVLFKDVWDTVYVHRNLHIVGIAEGKENAFLLVKDMIELYLTKNETLELNTFKQSWVH